MWYRCQKLIKNNKNSNSKLPCMKVLSVIMEMNWKERKVGNVVGGVWQGNLGKMSSSVCVLNCNTNITTFSWHRNMVSMGGKLLTITAIDNHFYLPIAPQNNNYSPTPQKNTLILKHRQFIVPNLPNH